MEENENVEQNDTIVSETKGGVANKKWLIIFVVIVIAGIIVLFNVFCNTKGKAKSIVKDYYSAISKKNAKKMEKTIDPYGSYVFSNLDKDDYEDFWNDYKDFIKSDKYDDYKDQIEEDKDEDIEDVQEVMDEYLEDVSIKLKSIKEVKKVGKNLYRVKAKVEIKKDDDKSTKTQTLYVMKKGLKCYIVGGYEDMF